MLQTATIGQLLATGQHGALPQVLQRQRQLQLYFFELNVIDSAVPVDLDYRRHLCCA